MADLKRRAATPSSRAKAPTTWVIDQRRGERSVPATATGVAGDLGAPATDDARDLCEEVCAAVDFYEWWADSTPPNSGPSRETSVNSLSWCRFDDSRGSNPLFLAYLAYFNDMVEIAKSP